MELVDEVEVEERLDVIGPEAGLLLELAERAEWFALTLDGDRRPR